MGFIQIQIIIFFSIIICSLIAGKKACLMATAVWIIETLIVYKTNRMNYLQIMSVSLSFQIGIFIAIIRDFIVKKIKRDSNKSTN